MRAAEREILMTQSQSLGFLAARETRRPSAGTVTRLTTAAGEIIRVKVHASRQTQEYSSRCRQQEQRFTEDSGACMQ